MAGKAWCCGGNSGGGGVTAITTTDTPTVDLSGDGSAGAPLTAAVLVAPEPNGVEAAPTGLLVAPSADAGNTLAVGSDGRLFVPAGAGGSTDVLGVAGSAPAPVGTGRSVDVDVAEGPAGTFNIGARVSPAWTEGVTTWAVPETGVYLVQMTGVIGTTTTLQGTSASADFDHRLLVNGAPVAVQPLMVWSFNSTDAGVVQSATDERSDTITRRLQLNAGDVITGDMVVNTANNIGNYRVFEYTLSAHKISD